MSRTFGARANWARVIGRGLREGGSVTRALPPGAVDVRNMGSRSRGRCRARSAGTGAMPNHRILLIEDDPAIRRGVSDALRFAGYKTVEAATYPDGLDAARGADADLVLLDLVLPGAPKNGQGGLDILKEVRVIKKES